MAHSGHSINAKYCAQLHYALFLEVLKESYFKEILQEHFKASPKVKVGRHLLPREHLSPGCQPRVPHRQLHALRPSPPAQPLRARICMLTCHHPPPSTIRAARPDKLSPYLIHSWLRYLIPHCCHSEEDEERGHSDEEGEEGRIGCPATPLQDSLSPSDQPPAAIFLECSLSSVAAH